MFNQFATPPTQAQRDNRQIITNIFGEKTKESNIEELKKSPFFERVNYQGAEARIESGKSKIVLSSSRELGRYEITYKDKNDKNKVVHAFIDIDSAGYHVSIKDTEVLHFKTVKELTDHFMPLVKAKPSQKSHAKIPPAPLKTPSASDLQSKDESSLVDSNTPQKTSPIPDSQNKGPLIISRIFGEKTKEGNIEELKKSLFYRKVNERQAIELVTTNKMKVVLSSSSELGRYAITYKDENNAVLRALIDIDSSGYRVSIKDRVLNFKTPTELTDHFASLANTASEKLLPSTTNKEKDKSPIGLKR